MKNILLIFILIAAFLTGCKKENDRAFSESPDSRLTASLNKYQAQLAGAENGWKAVITTDSGTGIPYSFYFKFNNQNRVTMLSDFALTSAGTFKESSYRLKALQQVSLLFDTYSYIHVLADPDPRVAGGAVGAGYNVDFEFYFDGYSNDTINLVGIKNGSKAQLIRATKAESDAYAAGGMANAVRFSEYYDGILNYWKTINISGVDYQVIFNTTGRSVTFAWKDASGVVHTFSTTYYYTTSGITLVNPLVNGAIKIKDFNNITWVAASQVINVTINGNSSAIKGTNIPVYVDLAAAKNWYQYAVDNNSAWVSLQGFRSNGVLDAYKITQIPNFYFLGFYPDGLVGGIDGDFGGFYLSDPVDPGLYYGPVMTTTFTADGKATFTVSSYYGTIPAVLNTVIQFNQAQGYYFVKTGDQSYDMVSVADSKIWINWIW